MSYGLRVIGSSGQKQMDDSSIVYVEHSRGTVFWSAQSAFDAHRKIFISLPEPSALVAVRIRGAETTGVSPFFGGYIGYSFSYTTGAGFRGTVVFNAAGSFAGETPFLEYIVYTRSVPAATGWGLNVYDSAGNVALSTGITGNVCKYLALQSYTENTVDQSLAGLSSNASDWLIVPHCVPYNVNIVSGGGNTNYNVWLSAFDRFGGFRRAHAIRLGAFTIGAGPLTFPDSPPNYLFPGGAWNSITYGTVGLGQSHLVRVAG